MGGSGDRPGEPAGPAGDEVELRVHGEGPHRCQGEDLVRRDANSVSGDRYAPGSEGERIADWLIPDLRRQPEEALCMARYRADQFSRSTGIWHAAAAVK